MTIENYKLVSFKKEVVVPHELTDRFLEYFKKFEKFVFHTYLIDEDDMCKISKYKITISNPTNPFDGVHNKVFEADINFEILEKNIENEEIIKTQYRKLSNLLMKVYLRDKLIYSIRIYKFYDSLQAEIFTI